MYNVSEITEAPASFGFATHNGYEIRIVRKDPLQTLPVGERCIFKNLEDAEEAYPLMARIAALAVKIGD